MVGDGVGWATKLRSATNAIKTARQYLEDQAAGFAEGVAKDELEDVIRILKDVEASHKTLADKDGRR